MERRDRRSRKRVSETPERHSEAIRVAVRIRPRTQSEIQNHAPLYITPTNLHTLKVHVPSYGPGCTREMKFDVCLGESATQEDVLECLGIRQLLDAASLGYNVCVLAYGPTGSGKTYTMTGDQTHSGLVQNSMQYLLKTKSGTTKIAVSYLEIYNECVFDLLGSQVQKLNVKWHSEKGYYVVGSKSVSCGDLTTLKQVLEHGLKNRRVGSTSRNLDSSRSHTLFTIHCSTIGADGCGLHGKVTFVDLAGSERLKDGLTSGVRNPVETAQINRSLFCLGNVILALSARHQSPEIHVPFRDSILTRLLMESLIGEESLTLLITCCSPCGCHIEEILNTLNYAQKAMAVVQSGSGYTTIKTKRNSKMLELKSQIDELKQENVELKEQLKMETGVRKITFDSSSQLLERRHFQPEQDLYISDGILHEIQDLRRKLHHLETRFIRVPEPQWTDHNFPVLPHRTQPFYPQCPLLTPPIDASCHTEVNNHQTTRPLNHQSFTNSYNIPDSWNPCSELESFGAQKSLRLNKEACTAGVITANEASLRFLSE